MITLRNLTKTYQEKVRVLDQIQLSLAQGEFMYVLGGTGAGKSTLLKILAGEEKPSAGQVEVFGYDLARVNTLQLQAIRRSISVIPQHIQLISDFSVFENVALGVTFGGSRLIRSEVRGKIYEILERLNLMHMRDVSASRLSGGEAQRVAVARALARRPEMILADEPTGAQDQQNAWAVIEALNRTHLQQKTVVLATHDREIVRRLRKKCASLAHGKMMVEDLTCSL